MKSLLEKEIKFDWLEKGEIPDQMPFKGKDEFDLSNFTYQSSFKFDLQRAHGMFAFVSWKWVNPLIEWIGNRKVLEVMAGAGWLAKALREKNVDIKATDTKGWQISWALSDNKPRWPIHSKIERLGANQAIRKYGRWCDIMIMSWPYMDDSAYYAIKSLYKINSKAIVLYIGEPQSGCTASDKFFNHFDLIEDRSFHKVQNNYERFFGLNDFPILGKYTENEI